MITVKHLFLSLLSLGLCSGDEEILTPSSSQNIAAQAGSAVLLRCKTVVSVEECQWSWHSEAAKNETFIIVKTFSSFGEKKQDCSVRFSSILLEQSGIWTCRVRMTGESEFHDFASTKLNVFSSSTVELIEESQDYEVEKGSSVKLSCKTSEKSQECQWSWRPLLSPNETHNQTDIVVQKFAPFGTELTDCSIRIAAVSVEQQGYWTCWIQSQNSQELTMASRARLSVQKRNIEFSELSADKTVSLGTSVSLICRTSLSVEDCQWKWKSPIATDQNFTVIQKFSPQGNNSTDCSIHYERIRAEQEGTWICGARLPEEPKFIYSNPISLNIYTGLEFVQLSREIQKSIGEPVLLQCVTNIPVEECKWDLRSVITNKTEIAVKNFSPNGEEKRDCSIRINSVLEEQEGLWFCSVLTESNHNFTSAPPTDVVLLPAVKTKFFDQPNDSRAAVGDMLILPCKATTKVEICQWVWNPLNNLNDTGKVIKTFAPFGKYGRDCSIKFENVHADQQGWWKCTVQGLPNSTMLSTGEAKLEVYEPVPVKFLEIPKDVHVPHGESFILNCVTTSAVEECQWSVKHFGKENITSAIVKSFTPFGERQQNCSIHINAKGYEEEGNWTCKARYHGETLFYSAPTATVSILKPDSISLGLMSVMDQKITLICQLNTSHPGALCHWFHPIYVNSIEQNQSDRFYVSYNENSSNCKITFIPSDIDFGVWRCSYTMKISSLNWEIASSSLLILGVPTDDKVSWLIGTLAGFVLVLILLLTGIVICKCRPVAAMEKLGLKSETAQIKSERSKCERYTESPSKIDFKFEVNQEQGTKKPPVEPQPIYERVDKYVQPSTCKSIYENVK